MELAKDAKMNWGLEDFAAAAVLMIGAAIAMLVVFRTVHGRVRRTLLAAGVILVVLAVWAELAVGIF